MLAGKPPAAEAANGREATAGPAPPPGTAAPWAPGRRPSAPQAESTTANAIADSGRRV